MLIKEDKFYFFHIDFGHLFNYGPILDSPRIAIPEGLQFYLSASEFQEFIDTLTLGFEVLRTNGSLIKDLCCNLFKGIVRTEKSDSLEKFIASNKSLMLNRSTDEACKNMKEHVRSGSHPCNIKKNTKDIIHRTKSKNLTKLLISTSSKKESRENTPRSISSPRRTLIKSSPREYSSNDDNLIRTSLSKKESREIPPRSKSISPRRNWIKSAPREYLRSNSPDDNLTSPTRNWIKSAPREYLRSTSPDDNLTSPTRNWIKSSPREHLRSTSPDDNLTRTS
jgi:hypothetical protein